MDPSILFLVIPVLGILSLRWLTGSPYEHIELNRMLQNSLERAVKNCQMAGAALKTPEAHGGTLIDPGIQAEGSVMVLRLQTLRECLRARHEQYGNMTVPRLKEKFCEVAELERSSLELLQSIREMTQASSFGDVAEMRDFAAPTVRPMRRADRNDQRFDAGPAPRSSRTNSFAELPISDRSEM